MSITFNNALVRKASANIIKAISSKKLKPSFEIIDKEHKDYTDALKKLRNDLKVE